MSYRIIKLFFIVSNNKPTMLMVLMLLSFHSPYKLHPILLEANGLRSTFCFIFMIIISVSLCQLAGQAGLIWLISKVRERSATKLSPRMSKFIWNGMLRTLAREVHVIAPFNRKSSLLFYAMILSLII